MGKLVHLDHGKPCGRPSRPPRLARRRGAWRRRYALWRLPQAGQSCGPGSHNVGCGCGLPPQVQAIWSWPPRTCEIARQRGRKGSIPQLDRTCMGRSYAPISEIDARSHDVPLVLSNAKSIHAAAPDVVLNVPRIEEDGAMAQLIVFQSPFTPCPLQGAGGDAVDRRYLFGRGESASRRELRGCRDLICCHYRFSMSLAGASWYLAGCFVPRPKMGAIAL